METRILDRVEELAARIDKTKTQANGRKPKAAAPKPKRKPSAAKKTTRRKT